MQILRFSINIESSERFYDFSGNITLRMKDLLFILIPKTYQVITVPQLNLSLGLNKNVLDYNFSTTSSTASSADTEFSKMDEAKLRDYISQLKTDRASVKLTVLELESVHIDPLACEPSNNPDAQRLDLENAVLMQELMAMKVKHREISE